MSDPKSQATEKSELLPCPRCGGCGAVNFLRIDERSAETKGFSCVLCDGSGKIKDRRAVPPINASLLACLKEMQASAEKLLLTVGWGNMRASERQAFNDASLRADTAIRQADPGQ